MATPFFGQCAAASTSNEMFQSAHHYDDVIAQLQGMQNMADAAKEGFKVVTEGNAFAAASQEAFNSLMRSWQPISDMMRMHVPAEHVDVFDHRGVYTTASGSSYAAPRVAALAARFLAKNTEASTADIIYFLKSRAIKNDSQFVKFGWIPDPSDDYKL